MVILGSGGDETNRNPKDGEAKKNRCERRRVFYFYSSFSSAGQETSSDEDFAELYEGFEVQ